VEWRPGASPATLAERARLLMRTRDFFRVRGVMEVQTPVLCGYAVPTPQIDSFAVADPVRFLRTSPEFAHKRLLAAGCGDIYELGPVFRSGELGARHNAEFTLLEWYRLGIDEHELMREVALLISALLPDTARQPRYLTYAEALRRHASIDLWRDDVRALRAAIESATELPQAALSRDDLLDLVFATVVAPAFEPDRVTFVHDYPATQASLAALADHDPNVARRFEAYVGPLELANGFYELRDATEQRSRFDQDNMRRDVLGKPRVTADERFLAALASGLPACAGVALGFDRVVMLATGSGHIRQTLAFDFNHA